MIVSDYLQRKWTERGWIIGSTGNFRKSTYGKITVHRVIGG